MSDYTEIEVLSLTEFFFVDYIVLQVFIECIYVVEVKKIIWYLFFLSSNKYSEANVILRYFIVESLQYLSVLLSPLKVKSRAGLLHNVDVR